MASPARQYKCKTSIITVNREYETSSDNECTVIAPAQVYEYELRVTELSLRSRKDSLAVTGDRTHWLHGQDFADIDEDDIEETPVNTIMNFLESTINVTLLTDKRSSPKGFRIEIAVRERTLPGCPNAWPERIDVRSSSGVLRNPPNSGRQYENCLRKTWIVSQPAGPFQNTVCYCYAYNRM